MALDVTTTSTGAIDAVTKADPAVITLASGHGLVDNDSIWIAAVAGMDEIKGETYYLRNQSGDTFDLHDWPTDQPIDSSAFGVFVSGTWYKANDMGKGISNVVDLIDVDAFTMAIWFYVTGYLKASVAFTTAVQVASGSTANRISLRNTDDTFVKVNFTTNFAPTAGRWAIDTGLSVNAWHLAAVEYDMSTPATPPVIYIDGASVAITQIRAPSGTKPTGISAVAFGRGQGGLFQYRNGLLGEAAFFSTNALGANQHAALARLQPTMHHSKLRAYWPMRGLSLGTSPELVQGATLTLENATATELHPPLPPFSLRRGNRSVIYVPTTLAGEIEEELNDTVEISDSLVSLRDTTVDVSPLTVSVTTPDVTLSYTIPVDPVVVSVSIPAVIITEGINVSPVAVTVSVPAVTLSLPLTVSLASVVVSLSVPEVAITTTNDVEVAPGPLVVTLTVTDVTIDLTVPVDPVVVVLTVPAITASVGARTYNATIGKPFPYTAADWGSAIAFYFEVYLQATTGTAYARLYDLTVTTEVDDSELSVATLVPVASTLLRSPALDLVDGHVYVGQFGVLTSSGDVGGAVSAEVLGI